MSLPYPAALGALLSLSGDTNRSLLWDRGVDVYDERWEIPQKKKRDEEERGKSDFLRRFRSSFTQPQPDFTAFLARRDSALKVIGAQSLTLASATRLVIGLGLPHPFETGFLFDRLSGCPYLPGSSVKGLVRGAARLVIAGELEGNQGFWSDHFAGLLGPEMAGGVPAAKGKAAFYDAFPDRWPELEIDVLTPHYRAYYEASVPPPPGDWEDPVPVPFLTVKAGTPFRFYFSAAREVRLKDAPAEIEMLLRTALDWLGIGAKKATGYGSFKTPAENAEVEEKPSRKAKGVTLRSTGVR